MRNPFPKIGKVMKYEFKHSARTLLPLYGVLLVLGLFVGLSVNKKNYQKVMNDVMDGIVYEGDNMDWHYQYSSDARNLAAESARNVITVILFIFVIILTVAVVVVTIVTLARRFKQSMLGEEAYLNLSLPATMGEQLWGRFITSFLWIVCCYFVIALAFILCLIRMDVFYYIKEIINSIPEVNQHMAEYDLTFGKIVWTSIIISVFYAFWIISLVFVVNAISHLLKNNKGFVKFLVVIVLLWVYGKTLGIFPIADVNEITKAPAHYMFLNSSIICAINFVWSAIYFAFTQYVFTKHLNLD